MSICLFSTTLYSSFWVSPLCRQPFTSHRQADLIPIDKHLTLKHGYDRNGGVPIPDIDSRKVRTECIRFFFLHMILISGTARYSTKKTFTTKKMQKRHDKRCSDEDGVMKIWSLAVAVDCKISKQ